MKVCLGGILALLSSVAFAYQYDVTHTGTRTYASELFGPGSSETIVAYQGEGPTVALEMRLDPSEVGSVEVNDTADVTMTLANAVLARNVRAGDFNIRFADDDGDFSIAPTDAPINIRGREDGVRGDNSVTFGIVATGTLSMATGTLVQFIWELPPLTGLNPRRNVTATVSVDAPGSSGFKSSDAEGVVSGAGTHKSAGGVLRAGTLASPTALIGFAPALTFQVSSRGNARARIDLTSGRTQLSRMARSLPPNQAYLGDVSVGVASSSALQLNGDPFSISRRQNGEGDLTVTVTGAFHETGDSVWLDLNGNNSPDGGEMLSLRDGVMSGRFTLREVAGDASATGSTPEQERLREEGVASRALIYRPNGVDKLRPSTYVSTFGVDFNASRNADKDDQASRLTTQYTVIAAMRQAYAIPPAGSSDMGNVRVKCEVSTECPVYLECDDSAGESWFVQLDEPIPGRMTLRLTTDAIATQLGAAEAGWDGRLSCNVLSTANISVQVLTRSGDVLVNNTYIDN